MYLYYITRKIINTRTIQLDKVALRLICLCDKRFFFTFFVSKILASSVWGALCYFFFFFLTHHNPDPPLPPPPPHHRLVPADKVPTTTPRFLEFRYGRLPGVAAVEVLNWQALGIRFYSSKNCIWLVEKKHTHCYCYCL